MIEVEKLNTSKQKIISTIRSRGPILPVQVAKEINFSPLFASAFLSELKGEGVLKISNLRVGSSPVYYIPGQEAQLEKFVPYLNQREKEAFQKLKQEKVLEDSNQDPVVRVALRAIKDFAIPMKARVNGEQKLFWKYFTLSEKEVMQTISGEKPEEEAKETEKEEPSTEETQEKEEPEEKTESPKEQQTLAEEQRPLAERKKEKVADNEFVINVKDYLSRKDIEILHIVSEKKKEFEAKIRINTDLGRQNYYLIAKDKKSVTDNDLVKAEKKARGEKLPGVFMSQGDLNKKGRSHLEQWGNLVRFEQLDL